MSAGLEVFRYKYQRVYLLLLMIYIDLVLLAVFPSISLQPELRAFHGSEIPIIFGTYNQSPIAPTAVQVSFSKFMQSAWVGFARNPKQGLINLGWPKYNPNTASIAQLGNPANATGSVLTTPHLMDIFCQNTTFFVNALPGFSALQALGAAD